MNTPLDLDAIRQNLRRDNWPESRYADIEALISEVEALRKTLHSRQAEEAKAHGLFHEPLEHAPDIDWATLHRPEDDGPLGFVRILREQLNKTRFREQLLGVICGNLRVALIEFVRVENKFGHSGQHKPDECVDCKRVVLADKALSPGYLHVIPRSLEAESLRAKLETLEQENKMLKDIQ